MMKGMKINTVMNEYRNEIEWRHQNEYGNETECSLDGNEGTNQVQLNV